MATASAQLNDYRQAPRKARLLASMVRGKNVADALAQLEFLGKKASLPFTKLIRSAVANAKALSLEEGNLVIKEIRVDQGKTLYRRQSASRGRAPMIRKRTSHIQVLLEEVMPKEKKTKKTSKAKSE